jgi:hypothetical protein
LRSRTWLERHGERIPPHRSDVAADPSVSRGLQDTILTNGLAGTPPAVILRVGSDELGRPVLATRS